MLGGEVLLLLVSSRENSLVQVLIFNPLVHHTEMLLIDVTCLWVSVARSVS